MPTNSGEFSAYNTHNVKTDQHSPPAIRYNPLGNGKLQPFTCLTSIISKGDLANIHISCIQVYVQCSICVYGKDWCQCTPVKSGAINYRGSPGRPKPRSSCGAQQETAWAQIDLSPLFTYACEDSIKSVRAAGDHSLHMHPRQWPQKLFLKFFAVCCFIAIFMHCVNKSGIIFVPTNTEKKS